MICGKKNYSSLIRVHVLVKTFIVVKAASQFNIEMRVSLFFSVSSYAFNC